MARPVKRRRLKISVTLAPEMVKRVADYQKEAGVGSFSEALEELLWRQSMEEREKAYYLSMSAEERAEQEAWTKFATDQFFKVSREG